MPYFGEKEVEIYQGAVSILSSLLSLVEKKFPGSRNFVCKH
jgi:hypothetical protein